jgi:hypothetical protein
MNLIARDFERNYRALEREELKRSPQYRQEFRRNKNNGARFSSLARRSALPLFWSYLFLRLISNHHTIEMPLAVISFWAAGTALTWGRRWFQQFYASEDLAVLNLLPLNDRQIFNFQVRRYFRSSLWIWWEMFLAYGVFAFLVGSDALPFYQLLLAAIVQSILVFALAIHAASRLTSFPLGTLAGLFRLTAFLLLVFGMQEFDFSRLLVQGSEWLLPTGWVNYMLLNGPSDPIVYALIVPLGAIVYLARYSFRLLQHFYSLEGLEIVAAPAAHLSQAPQSEDDEELTDRSFNRRAGPTEIQDHIQARSFLEGVNWETAGSLERFIARRLKPRERVITEFLVAQNPGWTRTLQWSFWIWLVTCVMVIALGQFGGTMVFFAAYILATASLPLFGGEWRGIRQNASGGVALAGYALYPISFNSIAKVLLKVNLIRIAAACPFIISFGALAAYELDSPPVLGAIVAFKLLLILACAQPLFILFPISATTSDTAGVRAFWWLIIFAPLMLLMLGAVIAIFISRTALGVLASYVVLLLFAVLAFVLYRRNYRRGKFDLLARGSRARRS